MYRARPSSIVFCIIFCLLLVLLLALKDELLTAHIDGTIQYFSSDASTYFSLYEDLYAPKALSEAPALFLIGSPILFLKLAHGSLFVILMCNLALMCITLKVGLDCFLTQSGRLAFMTGAFLFPYFSLGFLSLNKEIYAMCAAVFFGCYLVRGKRSHMVAAVLLAGCARYYMVLALLPLFFLVPRTGRIRYFWIFATLIFFSAIAPVATSHVPQYSSEGLLDDAGMSGLIFSKIINSGLYGLVYPIKYVSIILIRAYGFLIDSGRTTDAMEAIISVNSLAILALALGVMFTKRTASPLVRKLVVAGLVAPMPLMWSEIMHWRYFSFVYFFFLFAVVIHFFEKPVQAVGRNGVLPT